MVSEILLFTYLLEKSIKLELRISNLPWCAYSLRHYKSCISENPSVPNKPGHLVALFMMKEIQSVSQKDHIYPLVTSLAAPKSPHFLKEKAIKDAKSHDILP